jgi:hypothetical protein
MLTKPQWQGGERVGVMATVLWSFVVTIAAWYGAGRNIY